MMPTRFLFAVVVLFVPLHLHCQAPALYINEFLAINNTGIFDNVGDHDDWLELYNAENVPVDVGGMYLTDNLDNPTKWKIPETHPDKTTIPAGGFLLFWLDDEEGEGPLHAGFKLSGGGEQIGLYDRDGKSPVDSLSYPVQRSDVSMGRVPDGGSAFMYFPNPSPNRQNPEESAFERSTAPRAQPPRGFYPAGVQVRFSAESPDTRIYFSTDGTEPREEEHMRYTGPIRIDTTTVIRARVFEDGKLPSTISSHSYFVDSEHSIPVVSITTDPPNLWDWHTGIYVLGPHADTAYPYENANYYRDWEKAAHCEFFDGERGFSQDCGLKIAGGLSRVKPKKSFMIRANSLFGPTSFDYPMFDDKAIESFDGFMLRADYGENRRVKNGLVYGMHKQFNSAMDYQSSRPVAVYLNGVYWGLYNIMERKGKDFVRSNHGVEDADILDPSIYAIAGDHTQYNILVDMLKTRDMSVDSNYREAAAVIDLPNFIDYWIFQIYMAIGDNWNIRYWRPRRPDGKWRWISFDADWWLHVDDKSLHRMAPAIPPTRYELLGPLLRHPEFRTAFINRFADALNTVMLPAEAGRLIDAVFRAVEDEIPADLKRWDYNPDEWKSLNDWVRDFVKQRPDFLYNEILEYFSLEGTALLTIRNEQPGSGSVRVSTLRMEAFPWTGEYFRGVPVGLQAEAAIGYEFVGWSGASNSTSPDISLLPDEDMVVEARFRRQYPTPLVINEFSHTSHATPQAGDWVELHNTLDQTLDIAGWTLSDGNEEQAFTFPTGARVGPRGYLVLCRDSEDFKAAFPQVDNFIGDMEFGLREDAESLYLHNDRGQLVDSLHYTNRMPWPLLPPVALSSLGLKSPALDNAQGENWRASEGIGSPGRENFVTYIPPDTTDVRTSIRAFPNPFVQSALLEFRLGEAGHVRLCIYDASGRLVRCLVEGAYTPGLYRYAWNGSDHQGSKSGSGMYYYSLEVLRPGKARYSEAGGLLLNR